MDITYWQRILTSVKKHLIFLILLLFLLPSTAVRALRIARPSTFQLPWTEEQVTDLNNTLESLSLMQQGRFEYDIKTTPKTNARNGELWYVTTGGVVRVQIKAGDQVFTFTPDGF